MILHSWNLGLAMHIFSITIIRIKTYISSVKFKTGNKTIINDKNIVMSAIESNFAPKSVTKLYLRATYPSSTSLMLHIRYIMKNK